MTQQRLKKIFMSLLSIAGSFALASPSGAQQDTRTSSLSGAVVTDSGDVPIANAEVVIEGLNMSARSDSKGNFLITGVPVGPHRITVRQIGYEAFTTVLRFRAAEKIEADFVMKPVVTKLAKVDVKGTAASKYAARLQDFEERRKFGNGRFLTSEVFEEAVGQNLSQVLVSRIPGIRTDGKGTQQVLVSRRGTDNCRLQVIVNGLVRYNGRLGDLPFDVNNLYTSEIIGFEYYTSAQTPAQLGGTGAGSVCGTAVFWTK